MNSSINCVELFAGAGGLMLGLEMAGFNTLLANEVHPDPCKTMARNFPNTPIIQGSIKDYSGKSLFEAAALNIDSQEVHLLAGGPPCQGFSNAGMKDPDDPRNTLIGDYIRILNDIQPRYFILENVVGLVTLHKGKLFNGVLKQLKDSGYNFHHRILYAADYGVPQMRKRLIILGSKEGPPPPFPAPTHFRPSGQMTFDSASNANIYVTCGDALGDLPKIDQGEIATKYTLMPSTPFQKLMRDGSSVIYNHQASKHRKETMDYYGLVPPGGTWLDIPVDLRNNKQGVQRWPLNGLSRTITTEPSDFLHPTLNRIPTVRELARIQTFPDRYEFLGQRTTGNKMRRLGYCSQSQQVGNAVPPLLARAIGESVFKFITQQH
jgi:DNA (cytosine-5)-methyltransferase 1